MTSAGARALVAAAALATGCTARAAEEPRPGAPEVVTVRSGAVTLHALLWRPAGQGPFPAVLFNHGSGRSRAELETLGAYERQAEVVGPVFARHGYVLLYLFRRARG
jgi:carboxymethylenebutenolidase